MFGLESLDAEAVYLRLPVALQNAACTFVGWRTERTRYAGAFDAILEEAVGRTYWSRGDVESFRDRRLVAAVQRSATIPFYRDRFRAAGVEPPDIRRLADLGDVPILTKDEAREMLAELPPFTGDSRQDQDDARINIIMLGVLCGYTQLLPRTTLEQSIAQRLPRFTEQNLRTFSAGWSFGEIARNGA